MLHALFPIPVLPYLITLLLSASHCALFPQKTGNAPADWEYPKWVVGISYEAVWKGECWGGSSTQSSWSESHQDA